MGGEEIKPVDYSASVPITAASVRLAVEKLKAMDVLSQYNAMDAMMSVYFNDKLITRLTGTFNDVPAMPAWVQNLEREWRL